MPGNLTHREHATRLLRQLGDRPIPEEPTDWVPVARAANVPRPNTGVMILAELLASKSV